jgi:hypothetical protein
MHVCEFEKRAKKAADLPPGPEKSHCLCLWVALALGSDRQVSQKAQHLQLVKLVVLQRLFDVLPLRPLFLQHPYPAARWIHKMSALWLQPVTMTMTD